MAAKALLALPKAAAKRPATSTIKSQGLTVDGPGRLSADNKSSKSCAKVCQHGNQLYHAKCRLIGHKVT